MQIFSETESKKFHIVYIFICILQIIRENSIFSSAFLLSFYISAFTLKEGFAKFGLEKTDTLFCTKNQVKIPDTLFTVLKFFVHSPK